MLLFPCPMLVVAAFQKQGDVEDYRTLDLIPTPWHVTLSFTVRVP